MQGKPQISVIMSTCNGERYLAESVDSILGQTRADFEFIIVNDGSTDGTADMLEKYASKDRRIQLITNPQNIGLTKSLNIAAASAGGKYIARQDADDISHPHRLEMECEYLQKHEDTVLVSGIIEKIDDKGETKTTLDLSASHELIKWHLLFYNYVEGHGAVMFRKNAFEDAGKYNENFRYAQDYGLWLRLVDMGKFFFLPQTVYKWRVHGENITVKHSGEQGEICSLASAEYLKQLTGTEFATDDIALMRGFWTKVFPKPENAGIIRKNLRKIMSAFMDRQDNCPDPAALRVEINRLIEDQFIGWIKDIPFFKSPTQKLQVALQAALWNPAAILRYFFSG